MLIYKSTTDLLEEDLFSAVRVVTSKALDPFKVQLH